MGPASRYGTLTFGRQNTPLFDKLISTYDPLMYANYPENSWLPYALGAGLVADNAMKYSGQFGDVYVGAFYSLGGNYESTGASGFSGQIPGHLSAGTMYALLASYSKRSLSMAAGMQPLERQADARTCEHGLRVWTDQGLCRLFAFA